MVYDRNSQNGNAGDYYTRPDPDIQGPDYGSGRDYAYSSAREYQAAGAFDRDRGAGYGQRGGQNRDRGDYSRDPRYGAQNQGYGQRSYGRDSGYDRDQRQGGGEYRGSYRSDGHRFTDGYDRPSGGRDYGRQPQGYDYEERGFFDRAGDEVRSWFGDEEAERRRNMDARYDGRDDRGGNDYSRYGASAHGRDDDYHQWRRGQIDALDRDYHEYRTENRSKFETEFGSWRTERQGQRSALSKVEEHMDVVGSDGEHIGTVDKVRGDRILLTKNDPAAGGHHHSIPSRWIDKVEAKQVTVRKTAAEAKAHWRDEERNTAFFGEGGNTDRDQNRDSSQSPRGLNQSFSGTY
jgi:osmotically-inducible protein OsmY